MLLRKDSPSDDASNCVVALFNSREEKTPERKQFDTAIENLLRHSEREACKTLFLFIERTLKQYRLDGRYDIFDVFLEAYSRAIKRMDAGEQIKSPEGWIRGASIRIIQELHRKHRSSREIAIDAVGYMLEAPSSDIEQQIDLELLWQMIVDRFDPLDAHIVYLKLIEQLPLWHDIKNRIESDLGREMNEGALQKRYSRLKKKLKEHVLAQRNRYPSFEA